jgi:hypothetical protein
MPRLGADEANAHKFIPIMAPGEKPGGRFDSFMAHIPLA